MKIVYCGGGFNFTQDTYLHHVADDWRSRIVLGGDVDTFLKEPKSLVEIKEGVFYGGPYYFEDTTVTEGHVDFADFLVKKELSLIDNSTDCIFILDRPDILGTVSELMYAALKYKTIHIIYTNLGKTKETESHFHNPAWYSIAACRRINNKTTLYECKNSEEVDSTLKSIIKNI